MRDPLESATLKDELHERLDEFFLDREITVGEEVLADLTSEVYSFFTEVQEGEAIPEEGGEEEER